MSHTFTRTLVHVVFSTKDREPLIADSIRQRMHAYISGIIRESDGEAMLVNGTSDHVHILILLPPHRSIAEMVRLIKSNSSKWIHETYPEHGAFAWQTGYAAFSVSESNSAQVLGYIAAQEVQHRRVSFPEEYLGFLRKHGIAFDQQHIWD